MGNSGSKKTYLVKRMWWSDGNLHTVDIHGEETIYKNAYFTGYSRSHDSDIIKAEEIVYVCGNSSG